MTYGIICAMTQEFKRLEEIIESPETVSVFGRDFIRGKINRTDVIAVISRVGKVAAAATTTLLADRFGVDAVVFCGIAGSVSETVNIGDIVIAESCVQHDFYITDKDRFRIPVLDITYLPCDPSLSDNCSVAAKRFAEHAASNPDIAEFFSEIGISTPKIHFGVIASGDQFISSKSKKQEITSSLQNIKCVEMEGAAVAQVCYESDIPCAVIRVISDSADEDAPISFDKFVDASSLYTRGIISELFA